MKLHNTTPALAAALFAAMLPHFACAEEPPVKARERIGIYDSRAVAIAFAGSAHLKREMEDLTARHKKAKAAGDEKETSRLEAEGQARQKKLHQQGFSGVSIEDLLGHITGDLPKIKAAAGLSAIVSKWDDTGLVKHAGAEKVDVTAALIDAFSPTERARKNAVEIQRTALVPSERIDPKQ